MEVFRVDVVPFFLKSEHFNSFLGFLLPGPPSPVPVLLLTRKLGQVFLSIV